MCHVRAQIPKNQKQPHKADKKLLNLTRTSHRNTPLYPLPRGETYTLNYSLSNRKQHPSLPSREGLGVCHACAKLLKSKTATQSRQKTPQPNRTSHHNTPLYPLSRGETYTLTSPLSQKNSIPASPLERGQGVCDVRAQLPKNQEQEHKADKKHLIPTHTSRKRPTKVTGRYAAQVEKQPY